MEAIVVILLLVLFFLFVGGFGERYSSEKRIFRDSPREKGEKGERKVASELLYKGISPDNIFYDLYVEKESGFFSQIDLLLFTEVGIIVIEVKNYSGWIFGSGNQRSWTQILAYGKEKNRLYNPIIQNQRHIYDLRKALGFPIPFYSLIVFTGDCVLKKIDKIPQGTFVTHVSNMSSTIDSLINNNKTVNYINKDLIARTLKQYVENGKNPDIRNQHIQNTLWVIGNKK